MKYLCWILIFILFTSSPVFGEIKYNTQTKKIEMEVDDYKVLIDVIRDYEHKLKLLEGQLIKERSIYEAIIEKQEAAISFSQEKIQELLKEVNSLIEENYKLKSKLTKETEKSRVYRNLLLFLGLAFIGYTIAK